MFIFLAYLKKIFTDYFIEILMALCCVAAAIGGYAYYQNGFMFFGPTKAELQTQIENKDRVIVELTTEQKHQAELSKKQADSAVETQDQLVDHFENKQKTDQAFDASLQKGKEAFKEATKPTKPVKATAGSHEPVKVIHEAPKPPDQSYVLEDAQSPQSLTLAHAQFAMMNEAYCLTTDCNSPTL